MLVLVGKGGIYKTTLLGSILPPCLADYYANDSTGNYLDKNMQEAHACKGHICLYFPDAVILGHRDLPGVHKECPCFDTKAWLKEIDFHI